MTHADFMTTSETAASLRVSEHRVYRLVHERGLLGRRVKGRRAFRQSLVTQGVYENLRPGSIELARLSEARNTIRSIPRLSKGASGQRWQVDKVLLLRYVPSP